MSAASGTAAFYDQWAMAGHEAERSAIARHFVAAFEAETRVLDVGCGTGRDVVALLDMGFDAYGIEPNDAMRARALARDARLAGRIGSAGLPDIGQPFGGGFDAIVCSAVLMHLDSGQLPAALASINAALAPRARVLMGVPEMRPGLLREGVDPDGRLFSNHRPAHLQRLLAAFGFALLRHDDTPAPSTDTRWHVLLFERERSALKTKRTPEGVRS
jgi:SAM-dependent methyltransferase